MKKLTIHPLFLLTVAVFVFYGKSLLLINGIVAVCLHEYTHVAVARWLGYDMGAMVLMPYGGTVPASSPIARSDDVLISLAGPFSNLAVSVVLVALWWVLPESYYFSSNLVRANLTIALFNLLPAYPLDTSRVIVALAKNRSRALCIMRWIGGILGGVSLGFFVVSCFYTVAPSLLIIGSTLIASATIGYNKEKDMDSITRVGIVKSWHQPIERKTIVVDGALPLSRLLGMLSPTTIYTYEIVSGGRVIATATESELVEWSTRHPRNTPIAQLINKKR